MGRIKRIGLVVVALVLLLPQGANAGGISTVNIPGDNYDPAVASLSVSPPGQEIKWTNNDSPDDHTATSDGYDGTSGPKLWDTGIIHAAGYEIVAFDSAGTFKYHCQIHEGMVGKVTVIMGGDELGVVGDVLTMIWASTNGIPGGFNVDAQMKKPGKEFKDWKIDRTDSQIQGNFVPDKPGIYAFRARTQKGSREDRASRWSPEYFVDVSAS